MEKLKGLRRPIGKQIRAVKSMEKLNIRRRPIGKQIKRCKNYGKLNFLEETDILHLFLACHYIFQSLALEDDDEMTSNALFSPTLRFEINVMPLINFSILFQPPGSY